LDLTDGREDSKDLTSSQEEADTRMLLHALHASKQGHKAMIIVAEDTDVFILCLAFSKEMSSNLYMKCSMQNITRYVDISKLVSAIGDGVCQALVGLHAFTGSDTVSAFAGRGKVGALKKLKRDQNHQRAFGELGKVLGFVIRTFPGPLTVHV